MAHGRSVNKDNRCCISQIYQSFSHGCLARSENECRRKAVIISCIRAAPGGNGKHSTWRRP